jgi:hypothetical protein
VPGDERPDCLKDPYGYCIKRKVTDPEVWARLGLQISSIREDVHECREAKSILTVAHGRGMDGGRIQVWDGAWMLNGRRNQRFAFMDSDSAGRIMVVDWFQAVQKKDILVHEALHTYLNNINSPLRGLDAESWV